MKPLVNDHLPGDTFFFKGGPDGVLLVHGFTATTAEVRPLAEHLRPAGYTISGPLLPGHGTQAEDIGRCRWQDWYAAVERAYTDLRARCRRVAVGGESMGGALTLYLAANHPEVAGVLSYAPALRLALTRPQIALVHGLAPFNVMIHPAPGAPAESDALWKGYDVRPVKGLREILRLQAVLRPMLPAIHQPILIVQGRLDGSVHESVPQEIYDHVSSTDKEMLWLGKSTHCVALDCERQQLFEVSGRFLERVFKPSTEA